MEQLHSRGNCKAGSGVEAATNRSLPTSPPLLPDAGAVRHRAFDEI
jgi:hypothetical protein